MVSKLLYEVDDARTQVKVSTATRRFFWGGIVVIIVLGLGQVYCSRYGSKDKSGAFNRPEQSLIRFRSWIRSNAVNAAAFLIYHLNRE
jgi:hypothetical protein